MIANLLLVKKTISPLSHSKSLRPLTSNKKRYEVFGFAPYWTINQLKNIDFNILTTFAYFSIDVDSNGNLNTSSNGYQSFKSQEATDLFTTAHAAGTRVVATVTQLNNATILHLMDNPRAQSNAISQIVDLVDKRGIDGVNVDFEYLGDPGIEYRNKFSQFITNLTAAMHQRIPTSRITVSIYASAMKDPNIYDIRAVASHSDGIFMMAYDFATVGAGTAMPTDPLYGYKSGKYWYDISTAVDDFLTQMPSQKLILGLPWYGYDYPVYIPTINAETKPYWTLAGPAKTDTYALASDTISPTIVGLENYKTGWDSEGQVGYKAYYVIQTHSWRMVFIDDVKSMGIKYDFAKKKKLAGVGMWAMGFDDGKKDLWSLLNQKFGVKFANSSVIAKRIDGIE